MLIRTFISALTQPCAMSCDMGKVETWKEHNSATHAVQIGTLALFLCSECVSKVNERENG